MIRVQPSTLDREYVDVATGLNERVKAIRRTLDPIMTLTIGRGTGAGSCRAVILTVG